MKCLALSLVALGGAVGAAASARAAHADPIAVRCEELATEDVAIDGLLDDWSGKPVLRMGAAPDGSVALRCAWDGTALALALDIADDRVVRVKGKGDNDRVDLVIGTGEATLKKSASPGNAIAKSMATGARAIAVADSLQPKGFSLEARVPASAIPGFSGSTPALVTTITFHDADRATGGDSTDLVLALSIELGDRQDLLDDFLRTVKLAKRDLRFDTMAELDPDRRGKERIVAGGTVIGVLTNQFAFVSLPAATAADVKTVELLALGPRGQSIVAATVRQSGNGGSRDLLMMWTVAGGQLQPLRTVEIRKQLGRNVLESTWALGKPVGRKGRPLVVTPRPAVGFTADTWGEEPADDADAILLPWDPTTRGAAYTLVGKVLERRALPAPKRRR